MTLGCLTNRDSTHDARTCYFSFMDSGRSHHAKSKGKDVMPGGSDHPPKNSKRADNWRHHETTELINAIAQVQDKRENPGFSFTSAENQEIYNLFMKGLPDSTREKDKVVNRIKVVLKMFKVCDELAKRSGGGWDDVTNRPIAPSEKEYEEMVMAKGESGRFLLKGNFPWYRRMQAMVGGQAARGVLRKGTFRTTPEPETETEPEPIHVLLDSQMNFQTSEQGSSDDPLESSGAAPDSEHQTHRRRRAQTPSNDTGHRSDGNCSKSGNSGSKRKSTDDEGGTNVRGNMYKNKARGRQGEGKLIANAGHDIAHSMREETKAFLAMSEEMQACVAKLKELDFDEDEYDYTLNLLDNGMKRKWFLSNDRETILRIVRRRLPRNTTDTNPRPNPYAYNNAYQGYPNLNPAANTASNQFFQPPNPAASSFFFTPNDPNRDVPFM